MKEGKIEQIAGTSFFVFFEDKRVGENGGFVYLVTNRHMAVPGAEEGKAYPVLRVSLRLNLRKPNQEKESEEKQSISGEEWELTQPNGETDY